jgi:hypothetical protein
MLSDIDGIMAAGKPLQNVVFRNEAEHARYVERGGITPQGVKTPAYRVYAATARESGRILQDVLAQLGFRK